MIVPLFHSAVDYVVEVILLSEILPQFFPGFKLSFNAASRLGWGFEKDLHCEIYYILRFEAESPLGSI